MTKLSITELQKTLWEGINDLKAGKRTCQEVQAMTNASDKILKGVALQLQYSKVTGDRPVTIDQ